MKGLPTKDLPLGEMFWREATRMMNKMTKEKLDGLLSNGIVENTAVLDVKMKYLE